MQFLKILMVSDKTCTGLLELMQLYKTKLIRGRKKKKSFSKYQNYPTGFNIEIVIL